MAVRVDSKLDFGNARRITNLAAAQANGEAVTFEQLNSAIEGISWKDAVRVASVANIGVASPGATIDGITMAANDRVLLKDQTSVPENGIYIWNGASTPMTRSLDANTFDELEAARVTVEEGTNAGTDWRQTQVNGTIGTSNIVWTAAGTAAPAASETTAGVAEIATQAETDTGTDDARIVTPLKLANYAGRAKRHAVTIGDGAATSLLVTHNLNTLDVQTYAYEVAGAKRAVLVEVQHTSVNSVTYLFDAAPALNSIRAVVVA